MLLEIEEAVHHELTIQEGVPSIRIPDQVQEPFSISTISVDAQDPDDLA